jgi:Uma2 family endonuclease
MSGVATAARMTREEYLQFDEVPYGTSLVDGELIVSFPLAWHQMLVHRILFAIELWIRHGSDRGETMGSIDTDLDETNVYGPDLVWYRAERLIRDVHARPQPLPDVAVEVRSPSTWCYDIGAKKTNYERYGLPELWLVDTAADEVLVFRRSSPKSRTFDVSEELTREDTLTSPLLPGFALPLRELFTQPGGTGAGAGA